MDKYDGRDPWGLGAMGSAAAYSTGPKRGRQRCWAWTATRPPHAAGPLPMAISRITRARHRRRRAIYTPLALALRTKSGGEIEGKEPAPIFLTVTGGLILSSPKRTAALHVDDFFANNGGGCE